MQAQTPEVSAEKANTPVITSAVQLAQLLENVRGLHDMGAELIAADVFSQLAAGHHGLTMAAADVLAERRRQLEVEGMSTAGDDNYRAAELPRAAASYVLNGANDEAPAIWPWARSWWKPRDCRANYVRAGALILAEIERLDRASQAEGGAQ